MAKTLKELNALFALGHYILITRYIGHTTGGSSKHQISLLKITENQELIGQNQLLVGHCSRNKRGDFITYNLDTLKYYLPNIKQVVSL